MKLLIVDDDIWLCSALARGLVKLGHFSRTASSVESALALVASETPAAVLTDLDLGPGGNGVDLIDRLRKSGSTVPTLLMTGSDPMVARSRLRGAGLEEISILEKPFPFEDLMKRLGELMPGSSPELLSPAADPVVRSTPARAMAAMMDNVVRSLGGRVL